MMRTMRGWSVALVLAALAALGGCSKEPAPAPPAGADSAPAQPVPVRPNLVLITMDTTRADHLGCYGDARAVTPNLDAMARDGAVFEQAIAVAPLTLPAHASILTGEYPPRHGVRDNEDYHLPAERTTLAEHLAAQGYRARAVVAAVVVGAETGLAQGFEDYDAPRRPPLDTVGDPAALHVRINVRRTGDEVAIGAQHAIDALKGGPFFLWVHFFDPHQPYHLPADYKKRFPDRVYDGEIAFMDAQIGHVIDALEAAGLYDRTVVAAIADHGESLGQHGEISHGVFVYDATLHVPLIVRYPPKIQPGTRYAGLVSEIDLAPTLLDLMGARPLPEAQGRSVAAALAGASLPEREPVYAESIYPERAYGWAPLFALRSETTKFIEAPDPEIYDIATDRNEMHNVARSPGSALVTWEGRLRTLAARIGGGDAGSEAPADDERRADLMSLGYVSAGAPGLTRKDRPDPKRLIDVHLRIMDALQLMAAGRRDAADAELSAVVKQDPDNPTATSLLGALRFSSGRFPDGLARLRAAAVAAPGVFINQWNLGNALLVEQQGVEAAEALRAAAAIEPLDAATRYALGNALAEAGRPGEAIAAYRKAAELGLVAPGLQAALGAALADTGDTAGAEAALKAAVAADPALAHAWNRLGILLDRTKRRPEAVAAFDKALAAEPDLDDALFNRGRLRLLDRDVPGARADVDRLLAKHPGYTSGRLLEANVCLAEGNVDGAKEALRKILATPGAGAALEDPARRLLAKLGG
jgi:choline-sulfatase